MLTHSNSIFWETNVFFHFFLKNRWIQISENYFHVLIYFKTGLIFGFSRLCIWKWFTFHFYLYNLIQSYECNSNFNFSQKHYHRMQRYIKGSTKIWNRYPTTCMTYWALTTILLKQIALFMKDVKLGDCKPSRF